MTNVSNLIALTCVIRKKDFKKGQLIFENQLSVKRIDRFDILFVIRKFYSKTFDLKFKMF